MDSFFYPYMFYFYVIYSSKLNKYYLGTSANLDQRLQKHREKHKGFTGKAQDWTLVYYEEYQTLCEARKREIAVKNKKSRKYIEWLIKQGGEQA